jgi:hypothetical protein
MRIVLIYKKIDICLLWLLQTAEAAPDIVLGANCG